MLGSLSLGLACTHPPRPTSEAARGLSNPPDASALPHAEEGRFSVAIAAFRGDEDSDRDGEGDTTKRFADRIQHEVNGRLQVLRVHRWVNTEALPAHLDKLYAEHERAREVLEKTGAHVIVWGEVRSGQSGRDVVIRMTGSRDRAYGNAFPLAQRFTVASERWETFVPHILVALGIEAAGYDDLQGREIKDELARWLPAMEKMPIGLPPERDPFMALGLHVRGVMESDRGMMKKSVAMWQNAVDKLERRNDPGQWARLQGMYASVLSELYDIDDDEQLMQMAIARYSNAAEELTSSRAPRDFVVVHNQLGLLYRRSSMRSPSPPTLCSAVHEFLKAAEVSFDGDVPRYMDVTLRGLGNSLEDLTRPLPKGQKPDCLPPIDDRVWRTYQATVPK